jgi:hypothetical protein
MPVVPSTVLSLMVLPASASRALSKPAAVLPLIVLNWPATMPNGLEKAILPRTVLRTPVEIPLTSLSMARTSSTPAPEVATSLTPVWKPVTVPLCTAMPAVMRPGL